MSSPDDAVGPPGPIATPGSAVLTRDVALPGFLATRAAEWLTGDRSPASPARPSASVVLLRGGDGGGAPEVFMLRRVSTMAFAPDVLAFPGGGVDQRDAQTRLPWHGPDPAAWAGQLGVDDADTAQAVVVAAARELFEECGVLLAGRGAGEVVADVTGERWERHRSALLDRSQSFGDLLLAEDLLLRSDLLHPRARWVTPACEPRRYDTWFFAAELPDGQVPDDRTTEAAHADWVRPQALLADPAGGGGVRMLPPTRALLTQVATVGAAGMLRSRAVSGMVPVLPEPVDVDGAGDLRLRIREPRLGADGS